MHTVVRIYSGKGAAETIDLIIANKKDVKKLMHSVKGFIDYSVVKTEDGGFSVTVSKTEKASEAITAAALEWVMANAKTLKAKPPKVMGGIIDEFCCICNILASMLATPSAAAKPLARRSRWRPAARRGSRSNPLIGRRNGLDAQP